MFLTLQRSTTLNFFLVLWSTPANKTFPKKTSWRDDEFDIERYVEVRFSDNREEQRDLILSLEQRFNEQQNLITELPKTVATRGATHQKQDTRTETAPAAPSLSTPIIYQVSQQLPLQQQANHGRWFVVQNASRNRRRRW